MTQNRLRAGRAAMLATVALVPACSTSVVGTASPAGPTAQAAETADPSRPASAGPLDELLGRLALDDELGENLVVADLTGHPDGGAVLLARNGGGDVPDYVI